MPESGDGEGAEVAEVGAFVDAHLQPLLDADVPHLDGGCVVGRQFEVGDVYVADAVPGSPLRFSESVEDADALPDLPHAEVASPVAEHGEVEVEESGDEGALGEGVVQEVVDGHQQRGGEVQSEAEQTADALGEAGEETPTGKRVAVALAADHVHVLSVVDRRPSQQSREVEDVAVVVQQPRDLGYVLLLPTLVHVRHTIWLESALVHVILGSNTPCHIPCPPSRRTRPTRTSAASL